MRLLDAYAGTYERQPGVELRVWRDGDRLMGQVTGQPAVTLTAIAETRFAVDGIAAQLAFGRDDVGGVTEVVIYQNATQTVWRRID